MTNAYGRFRELENQLLFLSDFIPGPAGSNDDASGLTISKLRKRSKERNEKKRKEKGK